jgi:hypothetical protein
MLLALLPGCATDPAPAAAPTASIARPSIPLPPAALLAPASPPNCGVKTSHIGGRDTRVASSDPQQRLTVAQNEDSAALSQRVKLEHERDCYQSAEMRVRERLGHLQTSVRRTITAVRRAESAEAAGR